VSDKPDYLHDTIVAAATPSGVGGIGIVRISGPDVPLIAGKMLGGLPPPRVASLREFHDAAGEPIDTGLALFFPAPGSFTGEPVLELHGHGGPVVMALLVDAAATSSTSPRRKQLPTSLAVAQHRQQGRRFVLCREHFQPRSMSCRSNSSGFDCMWRRRLIFPKKKSTFSPMNN
jgi:hypothetical protein